MSAESEREFDRLLSEHVTRELTPHLGRSGRAFDEMIRGEQLRHRPHRRWFALASGASLIAASVVLALAMWRAPIGLPTDVVKNGSPSHQLPGAGAVRDVEQLVAWQT